MYCTLTLNGEIAAQFTNFSLIDQMNQLLNSRADYYGSPLPRVAIAPSHTAPSQWRSSFLVDCTVEICLLLPIFAHLILNDPLRNARGNRGNRHFLTRPAREFFYHESPSIVATLLVGLSGKNFPSHFVPNFKSVYMQGRHSVRAKVRRIVWCLQLSNSSSCVSHKSEAKYWQKA